MKKSRDLHTLFGRVCWYFRNAELHGYTIGELRQKYIVPAYIKKLAYKTGFVESWASRLEWDKNVFFGLKEVRYVVHVSKFTYKGIRVEYCKESDTFCFLEEQGTWYDNDKYSQDYHSTDAPFWYRNAAFLKKIGSTHPNSTDNRIFKDVLIENAEKKRQAMEGFNKAEALRVLGTPNVRKPNKRNFLQTLRANAVLKGVKI